jgi:hypothetical protein
MFPSELSNTRYPRCGADLEIVSAVTDAGQICR